jgi:hypothetical protein
VVVVDLGGGLAGVGSEDPAGILDEPAFEGDRCDEEEGVESGAVEAFANVGAGGDDKQRRPVGRVLQPGVGGGVGFGARAAAQDDRVVSSLGKCLRECLEVVGALGEHEAVPTVLQGSGDVRDDLIGSGGVGGEVAVDGSDAARSGRIKVCPSTANV